MHTRPLLGPAPPKRTVAERLNGGRMHHGKKESPAVTARTSCGVVQGRTQAGGVAAFHGIPFGEAGRFLPPTPAACWHGVLDALADGPGCPGMKPPYGPPAVSEQCLTLNVFTPVAALGNASARLSVLVWLYGGSLVEGSVASYGAIENLVRAAAGGRCCGVSGNYGILDQQLAMRWVAKYAAAFGGDAAKVTLLGQSSGSTSILALTEYRALRAAAQSGSGLACDL
ncbi:hypothetical protein EMIHUDRAFT_216077 [Emiliania huxleyi CCMP1516]|uniref:Carboxylic ester hydrolase n=2 Tax=Emiliania huxleyi TaxID=2903 RepID=A0A0D3IFD4_EMIH1|nr:hypothetical protein EMIHUDRAFT_216077 [Emiliania huxleyi CCMP1516]EOD09969.1 hypothetical protein EMIHUDRAFT_216077 [Emiliania huxleyi CCMP1516]|eukprot:XP_005762398.1 hypothetical protein EMIHUDRAFT_216077 [Emiliania huxleyi CCMP1516]